MEPRALRFVMESENGLVHGKFLDVGSLRSNERVDRALEDAQSHDMQVGPIAARLRAIANRDPDCLEAFATLGWLYSERGDYKAARDWYAPAVEYAMKAIPDSFSGRIEWGFLENRPFLRCHHGLACTLMHLEDWPACVNLFEQNLAWNPNDNCGIRWLLGDAYTHVERYDDAIRQLSRIKDEYPPARYSLAWIYFNQDRFAEALTELRKGFLENVYIAELIIGTAFPKKHRYWHGSNIAEPEWAKEHYEQFAHMKWGSGEIEFLDWAFNCATCLAERAGYRKHQEALSFERDISKRTEELAQMSEVHAAIRPDTSAVLIRRVRNRKHAEYWVWEREAYE